MAAPAHRPGLGIEAGAIALLAHHFDVGHELHAYGDDPGTFAGLASTPLDIERETPFLPPPGTSFCGSREQIANIIEHLGVGSGIGAGGSTDGVLIDTNQLVDLIKSIDTVVIPGRLRHQIQVFGDCWLQYSLDESTFP